MPKVKVQIRRFRSRPVARIKLPFPTAPKLRLAQLSRGPRFESVEPFKPKRWVELESYRPRVLIGRAADLQRLGEHVELGMIELESVDHAIVVLTYYGSQPITDVLRVMLWQRFGVPIYELYLGPDESLLASECAAHEGWHLEPGTQLAMLDDELILDSEGNYGLRTGLTGSLESTPCACGRAGERLLDVEAVSRQEPRRRLAASA
jgi:hypothetical protein